MTRISIAALGIAAVISAVSCNKIETIKTTEKSFRVIEYMPAPGQFINDGFDCKTMQEAVTWAQQRLDKNLFVSLGTFGGYLTVKASEDIRNGEGYDFRIKGNTLATYSEPGIVWVSGDGNSWFRLKGKDREFVRYSVTYRQTDNHEPGDIRWTDSDGKSGVVAYLPAFHKNPYYPAWVKEDEYTLSGTRLENRLHQDNDGLWVTGKYMAGYADNLASDMEEMLPGAANRFDLSDAVDNEGKSVRLDSIRYIKVQCAVIAQESSPVTGELSTELCGFEFD